MTFQHGNEALLMKSKTQMWRCIQNIQVQRSNTDIEALRKSWKEVKHAQLMDAREREEERRWDQEFHRRRQDLQGQQAMSSQRRLRNTTKLADLSARWRSLERKRLEKNEFYMERLKTSLSLAASRQESMSSGSPAFSFARSEPVKR
ncbi:hypothetical protein DPMN_007164 [Dreissena polymorpha]|uniref:Uncharacterized protein n=1 Tax=Dreissena polymorpha TaxID=45954 RepID=A0A9D4MW18_DREPO|nr:hypothetical protein DPMN_007164 [Dreissena polymorpha]